MNLLFETSAWDDYLYWQAYDKAMLKKVNKLIQAIQREPFSGIGKPEPLKGSLSGFWSRRINHEHRIIYAVEQGQLIIVQCRYHY